MSARRKPEPRPFSRGQLEAICQVLADTSVFRRCRPPIPTSRRVIPMLITLEERGSIAEPGCGLRVGVYRPSPVFVES